MRCGVPVLLFGLMVATTGCTTGVYSLPLMRPPGVFVDRVIDPLMATETVAMPADPLVLYATLREPAVPGTKDRFYSSNRAAAVRLGVARVELGRSDVTWEEARRISILKNGTDKYPIQVAEVRDVGVLEQTRHAFLDTGSMERNAPDASGEFAAEVNRRLAGTDHKDVFIYVPGYRVNFENPVLVAAELWHFLGYQGVFIPFSWPAHEGRLAYFGDTETAKYSSIFFRQFLEYLAARTSAERIHVVGYSAGTRIVASTLHELALLNRGMPRGDLRNRHRIGNVILAGSDVDRGVFGTYLLDGILDVVDRLTFYESPRDKALGVAEFVYGQERVGEMMAADYTPAARDFLLAKDNLAVISVDMARDFDSGNGHAYFRDSPWVSSDVLATLLYDLSPAERGLRRSGDSPVWRFPVDYVERLHAGILAQNPAMMEAAVNAGMLTAPQDHSVNSGVAR
jgi:esterase/lipase superfamily enzyme